MKYIKKPIPVTAFQFLPEKEIPPMVMQAESVPDAFMMHTITGLSGIFPGDWIIEEMDGKNYYPVKKEIFEETYVAVE